MARVNLKRFEQQLVVRPLRAEDWTGVQELQRRCFPGMEGTSRAQFDSQLAHFAEGQIGIEYQGRLVASSSSVILDFELYKAWSSWDEIADGGFIRNHKPQGTTLYGIELMVDPALRGKRLARRLYDARKMLARQRNLMRIVVAGRIPGYHAHDAAMTPREYIDRVLSKELFDPVLTTQLANGFVLKRIIPAYLEDPSSGGYAAFLEWTNVDYVPDPGRRFVSVAPVRVCVVQYELRPIATFEQFAKQCDYFVDVAADYKSDFILFPEIFTTQLLCLVPSADAAAAMRRLDEFTPRYLELFTDLAVRYNVNIIGGSHFTVEDGSLYNIAYLFRRDGTLGKQYKLHITPTERRWWGVKPGNRVEVFDTDRGRISIQICYDVEFPEVSRVAVEQGAQIIFVPFCTDERYGYLRVRYCAQARCVENQVYTAIAGSVGNLPDVPALGLHYAQSGVFTPSDIPFKRDAIAAEATPNIETVIFEDLDLELLKHSRQSGTVLNWNDRRTDVFSLHYTPASDAVGEPERAPRLSELIPMEAIALQVPVKDLAAALHVLAQLLKTDAVVAGTIERLLREREAVSSTAVGHGVALPHCRLDGATRSRVAILCARDPIDLGASDKEGVRIFVGVTSPPSGTAHLKILARLATAFRRDEVRSAVLRATDPGGLLRFLEAIDDSPKQKLSVEPAKAANGV